MWLHSVWGWYLPQTTSYIHIRHIQSVWVVGKPCQGHMGAPLYCYTGQVGPRFGKSGWLVEWKWCHNLMVEAGIHLRPLLTSIFDIYKLFKSLSYCLKGIWVHPYTIAVAKLAPAWGFRFTCGVEMMPWPHVWGWYPPQTASRIHISIRHIQSDWAIVMLSQGHMGSPLYCYTIQISPRFGNSGSLV